jgi:hypothetical protein
MGLGGYETGITFPVMRRPEGGGPGFGCRIHLEWRIMRRVCDESMLRNERDPMRTFVIRNFLVDSYLVVC